MEKGNYLDSWKDIAAYLGRNIRTCRNWERDLGLPVHRLDDSPKSHVFAYTGEIDAWREMKGRLPGNGENKSGEAEAGDRPAAPEMVPIRRSVRTWFIVGLVAGPLLAIIATVLVTRNSRPAREPAIGRLTIKVEPNLWLDGMRHAWAMQRPSRAALAISRDGRFIVYSAIEENPGPQAKPQLYLRRMDRGEAKPIAGTEGGINPFLSPDDRWAGFWAAGELRKISVEGGVPTALCDSPSIIGANWGPDNSIVFSDGATPGLLRISAEGGKPEILTKPDPKREESNHRLPFWLPNRQGVLFTVMRHDWDRQPRLALLRMDTHEWRVVLPDAADGRYVRTGHLIFIRQGRLMAVRFDLARMEVIGQPVALVDDLMQVFHNDSIFNTGAGMFGISDTGSLVYAAGGLVPDLQNSLVWVDQKGNEEPVTTLQFPFFGPRLSPDGQRIAYMTGGREWQVWVYNLGTSTNSPLTSEGSATYPIWSPDGKRLCFSWMESLTSNLYRQPYDGSSPMERLTTSENGQDVGSWRLNGKTVALVEYRPDKDSDISVLDVSTRRVTPLVNSKFNEAFPDFSPDGRWIAYSSDESKRYEVYVQPFPGPGIKQQVSSEGGVQPLWARNGKQLFYRWRAQMWVVDVQTDGVFATSKPRLLFEKPGFHLGDPIRGYDLSLDSQRFLMVKLEQREPAPITELTLVQNWFEELKRLVPAGKK